VAQGARPIDVVYNPVDGAVYALDFGDFGVSDAGALHARAATGTLFKLEL